MVPFGNGGAVMASFREAFLGELDDLNKSAGLVDKLKALLPIKAAPKVAPKVSGFSKTFPEFAGHLPSQGRVRLGA